MAADGRVYRSLVLLQIAADQGTVAPGDRMLLQLSGQRVVGAVIFTGNQNSCGIPVYPVHDAGAQNSIDSGQLSLAVKQERIAFTNVPEVCPALG